MDITQCSSFETGLQVVGHQNSCHFHHLPSFPLPPSSKKNSKLDKAKKKSHQIWARQANRKKRTPGEEPPCCSVASTGRYSEGDQKRNTNTNPVTKE